MKLHWNRVFFLVLDLFVYVNGKISFLPKLDYIFFMRLEMLKPNSNKTSTFKEYLNCSSFNQSQDKTRAIFGQILFEFGFLYLKFALPIALPILYMVLIVFSSIILSLSHIIKSYINVKVSTKVQNAKKYQTNDKNSLKHRVCFVHHIYYHRMANN